MSALLRNPTFVITLAGVGALWFYFSGTSVESIASSAAVGTVHAVEGAVKGGASATVGVVSEVENAVIHAIVPDAKIDAADIRGVLTGTYDDVWRAKQAVLDEQAAEIATETKALEQQETGLNDCDFHAYDVSDADLLDSGYASRGGIATHMNDSCQFSLPPPSTPNTTAEDQAAAEAEARIAQAAAARAQREKEEADRRRAAEEEQARRAAAAARAESARRAAEAKRLREEAERARTAAAAEAAATAARAAAARAAAAHAAAARASADANQDLDGNAWTDESQQHALDTYNETGHVSANFDDEAYW